jgi:hypothetical protein
VSARPEAACGFTVELLECISGEQVWAERYDRDLTDIFAIQDEISKAIVAALKLKLLPGEKKAIETRGTNNPEAYNLYLMARQHWSERKSGGQAARPDRDPQSAARRPRSIPTMPAPGR